MSKKFNFVINKKSSNQEKISLKIELFKQNNYHFKSFSFHLFSSEIFIRSLFFSSLLILISIQGPFCGDNEDNPDNAVIFDPLLPTIYEARLDDRLSCKVVLFIIMKVVPFIIKFIFIQKLIKKFIIINLIYINSYCIRKIIFILLFSMNIFDT